MELAAEPDGRLRGLRGQVWHDVGAYPASGPAQPGLMIAHLLSAYRLPALKVQATLVHTNTASTGFVRGMSLKVFQTMKSQGLLAEKNLGQVVSRYQQQQERSSSGAVTTAATRTTK